MKKMRLVVHKNTNLRLRLEPYMLHHDQPIPEGYEEIQIVAPPEPCDHVVGVVVNDYGGMDWVYQGQLPKDTSRMCDRFAFCSACGERL